MKHELVNPFGKIYLTTEYDQQNNWVYNNWMGYLSVNNIVDGANSCLELLTKTKAPYLLNDNRLVIGAWDHANEWIAADWTPRAVAIGLKYFAHVVAPETFAALSAAAMSEQVNGAFIMQIFNDMLQAKDWLRRKQLQELKVLQ